jgi:predicted DNA-binding transcriptional regulator
MGKLLGGGALIAVALFMLLGFFNAGAMSAGAAITTLLFVVVLPGGAGAALLRSHLASTRGLAERRDALRRQTQESEILQLAQEQQGRLTVVEVATRLALPPSTVESLLAGMHERGFAELEITDAGLIVYTFPDIQKLAGKGTSRNVLEA